MASSFKRSLPKVLIPQEKGIEDLAITKDCKLSVEEIQRKLNSYYDRLINDEYNLQTIEADIKTKTSNLEKLNKNYNSKIGKNLLLKNKIEVLKQNNESLKDNISNNVKLIAEVRDEEINHEKEYLDKTERMKRSYNSNRCVYNMYKKYTGCTITKESNQVVKCQFSPEVYVTLHSEDWKSNWTLFDIKPDVNKNEIIKKLTEVDDIQALLACVYGAFKPLIKKKI